MSSFQCPCLRQERVRLPRVRLRDVVESAENGCSFCSMLADNLGLLGDGLGLLRKRKRLQKTSLAKPANWYSKEQLSHALLWVNDLINPTWVHFCAQHSESNDNSKLGVVALQIFTSLSIMKPDGSFPYFMTLRTAADPGKALRRKDYEMCELFC